MKNVELYAKVRHAVRIEGLSERAAARRFGIDARTVNKMMEFSVPPGYVRKKPPVKPKLDPFIAIIDGILADDKGRPKKQQHTSKRIFERRQNVWLLRTRWGIPTVKINGASANPMRWPNGSFSIQGVAAKLGITPQTVFDYLARGLLAGHQLVKGQPWQIELSEKQIGRLRARVRHTRRSKKEAS